MSDHFDGQRFFNPGAEQAKGLKDVIRWKLSSRAEAWPDWIDDVRETEPPQVVAGDELRVTLVNHSTLLLQVADCNILTDPVWAARASPVAWAGPKRHRAPGVRFEKLPPIHLVLLSHNHYDHLDVETVRRLVAAYRPRFVVPLGVGALLKSLGADCVEVDWWDTVQAGGLPVSSVPARHFSARGLWDRNKTLWCGYTLRTPAGMVYFAGDTGLGSFVQEIRERCGPPRLALLPIGAYLPRWFMAPVHQSPAEAVRAHEILGAQLSIGTHFGTFQLADDGPERPVRDLEGALAGSVNFVILRNGEYLTLTGSS